MEISKEEFVGYIDEIKKTIDFNDNVNNFLDSHGADGCLFLPNCIESVLRLLHQAMEEPEEDTISRFCFDYEFGKKYKDGDVVNKYGAKIDLSDSGKLYDYLIENK